MKYKLSNIVSRKVKYYYLRLSRLILLLVKNDPEKIASKTINLGMVIIGGFFFIFMIWGVLAPINSASIANGKVVLDFNKKTIQHLEGGIIEKILVKEGENVVTNQPLISLRDVQTKSQNKMLRKQLITSKSIEARLIAERDNFRDPDFSHIKSEFRVDDISEMDKIIKSQKNLFVIRRNVKTSKIDILRKRVDQLHDEIKGVVSQQSATSKTLEVLYKQKEMIEKLVESNNAPLNKLLEMEKQIATSEGKYGELTATIAKAKQSISETQLEIVNLENESLKEVLAELQEIEIKISDLTEQLISAKDVLKRTVIKSPVSGTVTELKYHTIGAVIQAGAEIMYVIPQDDELIIEAMVNPADIDNVKAGLEAKVQITAFKAKKVPKLLGEVLSVSADILVDEVSGEQYFLARIRINEGELGRLKESVVLYPGMPAQAFIITGSRSLFNYLFSPITDAAYKAFRED